MSEVEQLERIIGAADGRDIAKGRREDADAMRMCDALEKLEKERAADEIEDCLLGWKDGLSGYPIKGFESPRFVDARKAAYLRWLTSEEGERTRRRVHPDFDAKLERRSR